MTIEDVYKKYDSVLYPQMYSLALVKDFMKKTFDMAVKDCNEYYQNELDEVYKNYADRLKDVLKKNEKLKIKVAYRHEVQTMLEKRIAELEAQNEKQREQLAKAKELLERLLITSCNSDVLSLLPNCSEVLKVRVEAEQFLNSEVEK